MAYFIPAVKEFLHSFTVYIVENDYHRLIGFLLVFGGFWGYNAILGFSGGFTVYLFAVIYINFLLLLIFRIIMVYRFKFTWIMLPHDSSFLSCGFGFILKSVNIFFRPLIASFRPIAVLSVGHGVSMVISILSPTSIWTIVIGETFSIIAQFWICFLMAEMISSKPVIQ